MSKIKVLIVDDSALMRQLMREILSQDPDFEVVDTAADPMIARDKILKYNPDVLTLDVEMPRMDGLTFLEKLMAGRPMPVVMVSSLTEKGCETTLRALELGAIDFVTKPKIDLATGIDEIAQEIVDKVRAASRAQVRRRTRYVTNEPRPPRTTTVNEALLNSTHKVIAIGTSTGGTEALADVLMQLPPDAPGVVAVIHMPERFTHSYAERLDRCCQIRVKEATDGDRILPGHALIAPGNFHMEVARSGASYSVRVFPGEAVNRHRPSVDVLFRSCARYLGKNCVGAILTGMGNDGATGLLAMRQAGARTIAESEKTCVVYGMPREAIEVGAAEEILPLGEISGRLIALTRQLEAAHV